MKLTNMEETVRNHSVSHFAKLLHIGLVSFTLLSVGLQVSPLYALPATNVPLQEKARARLCLSQLQGTLSATPQVVTLGQTVTLHWNVTVPSSCADADFPPQLYVSGQVVISSGSRTVQPSGITSYRLYGKLPAAVGSAQRTLATTGVTVNPPPTLCPTTIFWDADRDGVDDGKENCLLNRYAPVLYMPFDDDSIRPANVDWYLARTTLRFHHNNCNDDQVLGLGAVNQNSLITQSHPTKQGPLSGCDHTSTLISSKSGPFIKDHHFFLHPPSDATYDGISDPAQWKVYGHVYKNSIGGLNLQYWFLYPFDDQWGLSNHEGDWESIIVRLTSAHIVDSIYFCAHGDCSSINPNNVQWLDVTHPVGWVAAGSHATFPNEQRCDDAEHCQTKDAYRWFTWANGKQGRPGYQGGGVVNVGEKDFPLNGQSFIQYYGRWGKLFVNSGTNGPITPSYQSNWTLEAQ